MSEIEDRLNSILENPEELSKLMAMAKSLSAEFDKSSEIPDDGDLLSDIKGLFGNIGKSDDKTALLLALKPYLSEDRQKAVDKAVQLVRISRVARIAMNEKSGGDEHV